MRRGKFNVNLSSLRWPQKLSDKQASPMGGHTRTETRLAGFSIATGFVEPTLAETKKYAGCDSTRRRRTAISIEGMQLSSYVLDLNTSVVIVLDPEWHTT